MDPLEKFLRQIGPLIRASEANQEPVPPEILASLNSIKVGHDMPPIVLTEAQMRMRILKMLSETPLDGMGLIERLKTLNFSLADEGDLFVYAILYKLEETGLLKARRNVNPTEIVTFYHVTNEGSKILQEDRSILATPATQPSK